MTALALPDAMRAFGVGGAAALVDLPSRVFYKLSGSADARKAFLDGGCLDVSETGRRPPVRTAGSPPRDRFGRRRPRVWASDQIMLALRDGAKTCAEIERSCDIRKGSCWGLMPSLESYGMVKKIKAQGCEHFNTFYKYELTDKGRKKTEEQKT